MKYLFDDRLNRYDSDGGLKGYLREDPISEGRYNKYEHGKQEGYLKRNPLFDDRINEYDDQGRLKRYWKEDPFTDGRYNFERNPEYGR